MKSGRRACSPDGFRSFLRGGQAAKPLCPPTTRNAKRSESGVLNSYHFLFILHIYDISVENLSVKKRTRTAKTILIR